MNIVIADASIWIGAFVKKDKWHENGKKFLQWLQRQENIRVIIPIGVIYEVVAGILNKPYGGYQKANKAVELFERHKDFEIYYNTEESYQEVLRIFRTYEELSLVDSTIVLLYKNKRCSILFSTDKHFNSCTFINKLEFPISF